MKGLFFLLDGEYQAVSSGGRRRTKVHIALLQDKFLVGDLEGNAARILQAARTAAERKVRLLICSELALTAYPPTDLLLRKDFLHQVEAQIKHLLDNLPALPGLIVGAPLRLEKKLYNAAFYIEGGRIVKTYCKMRLPNYAEFDERRWFSAGVEPCIAEVDGIRCALTICEDLWDERAAQACSHDRADLLININASPFHVHKSIQRDAVLQARCRQTGLPIVYANSVGGHDDLVFDGDSRFVSSGGESAFTAPAFTRGLYSCRLLPSGGWQCDEAPAARMSEEEKIWTALLTGLRDYCLDNRLRHAVIGLSGGVDSALTLLLTVQALGAQHVTAMMMRSRWTADISIEDARVLASRLGVCFHQLDVDAVNDCALHQLRTIMSEKSGNRHVQLALENIQARLRGNLLMTLANSRPETAVIATGNKSEFAVGYTTLYGDMAGAYAPLKDVSKTRVYRLARFCNRNGEVIPQRVIDREPSAELSAGQRDQDTLPPYPTLDAIVEAFVEHGESYHDIVRAGIATADVVGQVLRQILKSEYKRYQAPPGAKITPVSFGRERRYPMTSGFNPKG